MPSFRTDNRFGRRRNALIPRRSLVIAGALLLIAFVVSALHVFLPGTAMRVFAPLWSAGNALSRAARDIAAPFYRSADLLASRDQLAELNLELNEENRTLRARLADFEGLRGSEPAAGRTLAGVLARPPVAPYDTLIVSLPAGAPVSAGALAYAKGGTPIGTVDTVTGSTARIALFSTGGRATEGWVGEQRVPVTLTGRGAGAFEATLPRESSVQVNDVVYVPGPGALPVGAVVRIDSDPSAPRDVVHIAPYANLFTLAWVEIASSHAPR